MMPRGFLSVGAFVLITCFAVGCARQNTAQQDESAADSLLAANPTEQVSGDITPQSDFQEPAPSAAPVATRPRPASNPRPASQPPAQQQPVGVTVPSGTPVKVTVNTKISSETAQPGESWTGTVAEPVIIGSAAPIPAGSTVQGVITGVKSAERGSRAFLVLSVQSIEVGGKTHRVMAGTDSIIAGSTRARNLGAIAGGAAAGALIGKAVGGSGKGALIGGLIGGAAATGAVAASKGYQVELKEGTELTFTTNDSVVMR